MYRPKGSSTSNSGRNNGDGDDEEEGKGKGISKGDRGDSIAKLMSLSEGGRVIEEQKQPPEGTKRSFYGDAVANAFSALGRYSVLS